MAFLSPWRSKVSLITLIVALMILSGVPLGFQRPATNVHVNAGLGGPDTANMWVDTDGGGSCTYSATPLAWNDSTDCGTFDAAYDVIRTATGSACGGVINIKAGTYPAQSLSGYRTCGGTNDWTKQTLFRPENFNCDIEAWPNSDTPVHMSGSASFGDSETSGASGHVTLCGLTFDVANVPDVEPLTHTANDNSRRGIGGRGGRFSEFKRSIVGGFTFFLWGFDLGSSGSGWLRIRFNRIEEYHEYSNVSGGNGKLDICENCYVEHNFVRNARSLENCINLGSDGPPGNGCGHHEPFFLNGTKNLTLRRNRIFNYEHSGGFFITCSGSDIANTDGWCHENMLIENNWLESPHNTSPGEQDPGQPSERGEAAMGGSHCNASPRDIGDYQNIIMRNNTVMGAQGTIVFFCSDGAGLEIGSGAFGIGGHWIIGNIANRIGAIDATSSISAAECGRTDLTIDYNVGTIYATSGINPCGANRINSTLAASILTNAAWGSLNQDAHLISAATVAQALVPETYCPDDDFWGNPRPAGPCAAGALEFGSSAQDGQTFASFNLLQPWRIVARLGAK